mgnify:CR=1 FL=1|tara:strand:+ start:411 stop:1268 length:858 start_codon:yes stop_codon:yes gene_type:complete
MGIFDFLKKNKNIENDNGLNETYYDDGSIKERYYKKHGKEDGSYESFYENSQLKSEKNYKNNKKDGVWKEYYKNSQLKSEKNYKTGKLDGLSKGYYKDGQLKYERTYLNNQKDGLSKEWNENGELKHEELYKKNEYIFRDKEILKSKIPYKIFNVYWDTNWIDEYYKVMSKETYFSTGHFNNELEFWNNSNEYEKNYYLQNHPTLKDGVIYTFLSSEVYLKDYLDSKITNKQKIKKIIKLCSVFFKNKTQPNLSENQKENEYKEFMKSFEIEIEKEIKNNTEYIN